MADTNERAPQLRTAGLDDHEGELICMSERAKPKHVRKQNWSDEAIEWQTGTGEFDREATIENRELLGEGKRLQYTAPGVEQKWRARDLVDIHWKLVSIDPPSESYNRIMSCIIGHANPHNGRCQLKQKLIAAETGYSVDPVQRAIKWWESKGFLKTQSMGLGRSTAYQPQWNLFELHFIGVAHDIATQKESWALASCYQPASENVPVPHQGAARGGHHGAVHESQIGISKDEPQHEMVRPPLVADTGIYLNEKEGIQREEVEGLSKSQPPCRAQRLHPHKLRCREERGRGGSHRCRFVPAPEVSNAVGLARVGISFG